MPGPMPPPQPQGGPPGAPPSAGPGAPPSAQGQGGGGAISQLLGHLDTGIDQLNQVIGSSKAASPQDKALIKQIDSLYGQLMDSLQGGGDDDGGGQDGPGAQGQTVPPEAAGNKGAMPSTM